MKKIEIYISISLMLISFSSANNLFIDSQLSSDCSGTYSTIARDCSGLDGDAYDTIAEAADAAHAGDTIYFRQGTYDKALIIKNSGADNNYITFTNYADEDVIISNPLLKPAIDISDAEYIIIDGLKIDYVRHWLYALNSEHVIIRNNYFGHAIDSGHSQRTGLFFQEANFNKIINNTLFDNDEDSLALIKSDYNVVEGNNFINAWHTLWTIKCGNHNIIRKNHFHNEEEKIGEVFDCHDVGFDHEFNNILNATKYNLIENNIFTYVPPHIDHSPYSGIQYAGQRGIIRNNIFYDLVGPDLRMSLYPTEAKYNIENHIYNNVYYNSSFAGISLSWSDYDFYDNIIKNNIFKGSVFVVYDDRWEFYRDIDGLPVQFLSQRLEGFHFSHNDLFHNHPGEQYLITYGLRDTTDNPVAHNVSYWNQFYPELYSDNIDYDPMFLSETSHDFHLKQNSPCIDAGGFLTKITSPDGTGTTFKVEDALYFYDGWTIPGEQGDLIQLEGDLTSVRIIDIDYDNDEITVDNTIKWYQGQKISLAFNGAAPDIGAYEYETTSCDTAADCSDMICKEKSCENNACAYSPADDGTLCNGDCRVCNGGYCSEDNNSICQADEICSSGSCIPNPECISNNDMLSMINKWFIGEISIQEIIETVSKWKNGC